MNKSLVFWLAVMMMFAGSMTLFAAWKIIQRQSGPVARVGQTATKVKLSRPAASEEESTLTDFEFTERSGQPFGSEQLDGKVYVASFFFASCPSTCRAQNEKMQTLQRLYADQDVRFLSITCDPDIDTPEVLRRYAAMFNADSQQWLFLTGEMDYIRQVGNNFFQVPVDKQGHTEKFIVVDRSGEIRGYYHWAKPEEFAELQKLVDQLLDEPAAESDGESASSDDDDSTPVQVDADAAGGSEAAGA